MGNCTSKSESHEPVREICSPLDGIDFPTDRYCHPCHVNTFSKFLVSFRDGCKNNNDHTLYGIRVCYQNTLFTIIIQRLYCSEHSELVNDGFDVLSINLWKCIIDLFLAGEDVNEKLPFPYIVKVTSKPAEQSEDELKTLHDAAKLDIAFLQYSTAIGTFSKEFPHNKVCVKGVFSL